MACFSFAHPDLMWFPQRFGMAHAPSSCLGGGCLPWVGKLVTSENRSAELVQSCPSDLSHLSVSLLAIAGPSTLFVNPDSQVLLSPLTASWMVFLCPSVASSLWRFPKQEEGGM